jgi:hypothetical protein
MYSIRTKYAVGQKLQILEGRYKNKICIINRIIIDGSNIIMYNVEVLDRFNHIIGYENLLEKYLSITGKF